MNKHGTCLACSSSILPHLDKTRKPHYYALEKGKRKKKKKKKKKTQRDLGNELFGGLISLRGAH